MNTTKSTKRSLMMSIVSLLLCFSMLLGTTYAWFTDSASSSGNKIVAGTLDVELWLHNENGSTNIGDNGTPIFGVNADSLATADPANTVWEPGKTQTVYLSIKNAGNLDLKYAVAIEVLNATRGLEDYMEYKITPDAMYGERVEWTSGNKVSVGPNNDASDVPLKAGQEHFFALSVHMDELATNAQMGGTIEFDIKVLASQLASESDSLGNGYDAGATYPSVNNQKVPATGAAIADRDNDVTVYVPAGDDTEGKYSLEVSNKNVVADNGNGEGEISLNITLKKDGVKVSGDTYTVRVKIAEAGTPLNIAKVTHNGEEISAYTYYDVTGEIEFTTTHFSPFVITYYDSNMSVDLPEGATDAEKAEAMGEKLSTLIAKGGIFTLTEDVILTEALVIPEGKTVTLDLNGKTITAGEDGYALLNESGSNVILTDSANGGEIVGVISNANGSVMTVKSGTYSAKEGGKYIFLNDAATLTINGGTINGCSTYSIYSYNDGQQLTINDVTVNGIFGALNAYGKGTVEINGGTYNMTGVKGLTSHIVYISRDTTAIINGGSFNHVGDISMSAAGGGGVCVNGTGNVIINGGEFNGDYSDIYSYAGTAKLTIKGGSFAHKLETQYVAEGFKAVEVDDIYMVIPSDHKYVTEGLFVNSAGDTYYVYSANGLATMNQMMVNKTAGVGITVELMADIDFAGKTWTPVDSHVDFGFYISELNGNGHTLSNLTINGQAMFTRFSGSGNVVVRDITFDKATVNSNGNLNTAILTVQTYQNTLLDNVDVKNSTITGGYKVAPLIGSVYDEKPSSIVATVKNCDVSDTVVTATTYDFFTCGMIAFVYTTNNDYVEYENCSITNVQLYAPNVYSYHANIHYTSADTDDQINEHPGVTVTNVTFENIN